MKAMPPWFRPTICVLALLAACSSSSSPDAGLRNCVPGASVQCTCSDGTAGAQVCNAMGSALGMCACAVADAAVPDVVPVDAQATSATCEPTCAPNQVCVAGVCYSQVVCVPACASGEVCVDGSCYVPARSDAGAVDAFNAPDVIPLDVALDLPSVDSSDVSVALDSSVDVADVHLVDISYFDLTDVPIDAPPDVPADVSPCLPPMSFCRDMSANGPMRVGYCANLSSDLLNCGACENACPTGSICDQGTCHVPCVSGMVIYCRNLDQCVDLTSNSTACGSCSNSCFGSPCVASHCTACGSAIGYAPCPDGVCVSPRFDDTHHCGSCSNDCGSGYCIVRNDPIYGWSVGDHCAPLAE